jgi:hypothetical protein
VRAAGRLEGTEALALPQLSRAMDVLEAQKEEREKALSCRLAARLTLAVERLFDDPTAGPFAIDELAQGYGADDWVEGRRAAGAQPYQAPRTRGLATNGRSAAPPIVSGLAGTRDGLPGRPWGVLATRWLGAPWPR